MEDQRGARHIARERGVIGGGEEPAVPEPVKTRSRLAERLDVESILAVLPYLQIATVAEFEREYNR